MIIISQDKTTIINFDNVHLITKNDDSPYIFARTNVAEVMLGKYETEERALEVLDDLARVYGLQSKDMNYLNNAFIMPEE